MENENKTWYFINGTEVDAEFGSIDDSGWNLTIDAFTNKTVGFHQTYFLQCTDENILNELYQDIEILQNSANIKLQTQFEISIGESINYTLPNATDDDPLQLVIEQLSGYDFPEFVQYDNTTSTLMMFPGTENGGTIYKFAVVVREKATEDTLSSYIINIVVNADTGEETSVTIDTEELLIDYYRDNFYPNIRFPDDVDQIMYQLLETFRVYVLDSENDYPVESGCDWDDEDSCDDGGNECCAMLIAKDTYTEIIQTEQLCLSVTLETDLETLEIGAFKYKIKCGGFQTSDWTGFDEVVDTGAHSLKTTVLFGIMSILSISFIMSL